MNRLIAVLMLCFALSAMCAFGDEQAHELSQRFRITDDSSRAVLGWVHKIEKEVNSDGLYAVAVRTDAALDRLVEIGNQKLAENGEAEYAYWMQSDWNRNFKGFLTKAMSTRHIGDHPTEMLSQWIESFYDKLELVLGVAACKATHLSDLKTLNCATKICFKPCTFEMNAVTVPRIDEYRNHFAKDDGADYLYGEVPVITYWAVEIGLMAAGAPVPFVAGAAEYAMGNWVAPRLSDMVFNRVCQ